MVAAYVSSAAQGVLNTTASVSVNEPAGAVGDLLVAWCWANNVTATWTPPAGWSNGDADAGAAAAIFFKTATDTGGGSQSFTRSNSTGAAGVTIARYSGASGVHSSDIVNSGASNNTVLPSLSPAAANTLLAQFVSKATVTAGTWTPPGTATERVDANTGGAAALPYAVGDEIVGAGATGTRTWVNTNSQQGRGAIVAITSAATPPGQGTGAGTWTWHGAATGEKDPKGTGAGTWTFAGAAAGEKDPKGTGAGAWNFAGAAVGESDREGSGPGLTIWSGAASGQTDREGSASGTTTWHGVAVGTSGNTGVGLGDTDWNGVALGSTDRAGDASGLVEWDGQAAGVSDREGTATGEVEWNGSASGVAPTSSEGTASGDTAWHGTAFGPPKPPALVGAVKALQALGEVLDLLTDPASGCLINPLPCRVAVYPGLEVAWDTCESSSCSEGEGQLWANLTGQTVQEYTGSCRQIQFTAEIGVIRCAAKPADDGTPPSAEAVQADAVQQALDSDAILYAISCCNSRSNLVQDIMAVSWIPLGPEGGCVGGSWTVRGAIDVCC